MSKKLIKSSLKFSLMTFLSRIFGYVRDMVMAYQFGANPALDAFILAFKIPNLLRRFFAEGAFSQAFVPMLSEYRVQHSEQALQQFINRATGNLLLVLTVIMLLGMWWSPYIVQAFAPGFQETGRLVLASEMLRITFPYILLISMTALCGAILNSFDRFAAPAFTPVFLNLCMIAAAWYLAPTLSIPEMALAWGVLLAGFVQLGFLVPFLARIRMVPKPTINWQDPAVKRLVCLMGPAILGASIAQINMLVDAVFASFLPGGSISWLYYSDRLMEFPLGVFGVGLATVVLPSLSRAHAQEKKFKFSSQLDWGLRWVVLVGLPAAVGLAVLAGPLLATLFYSGRFTEQDVLMSQQSLIAYAIAVFGIMTVKVLSSGFFAMQDFKTPVKIGLGIVLLNIILNACLIQWLAHAGLALATSISAVINALLLKSFIQRKHGVQFQPGWFKYLIQIMLACWVMGGILYVATPSLSVWFSWGVSIRFCILLATVFSGMLLYMAMLWILGLRIGKLIWRQKTI